MGRLLKRREVLKGAGAIALALGTSGLLRTSSLAAEPVRLKLIVWNYQVETVRQFLNEFERENPDIKVDMEVIPGDQYITKIQLMRNANTPFDVHYVADGILGQWAPGLEPLDGYEGAEALKKQMLPLASQSMTYKGVLYGLPYFSSYFGIVYSDKMLKAAGISGPPKTYEEWSQQARTIRAKGLSKTPMIWPVKLTGWGGMWVINTMAASRGGKVLDSDLNVTSEALDSLRWWTGTYKEGLSDPNGIELDPNEAARAFMSGDYATMMTANFFAGPQWVNNSERSKVAGFAKLGPTPNLNKTVGFARLYGMNRASTNKKEAWRLMKYMGGTNKAGEYVTPREWVIRGTLTWGYRGIEKDPSVAASLRSWGGNPALIAANLEKAVHMSAVVPFQAAWYTEWELHATGVLQNALSGRIPPEEAAQLWSKKAKELAATHK